MTYDILYYATFLTYAPATTMWTWLCSFCIILTIITLIKIRRINTTLFYNKNWNEFEVECCASASILANEAEFTHFLIQSPKPLPFTQ